MEFGHTQLIVILNTHQSSQAKLFQLAISISMETFEVKRNSSWEVGALVHIHPHITSSLLYSLHTSHMCLVTTLQMQQGNMLRGLIALTSQCQSSPEYTVQRVAVQSSRPNSTAPASPPPPSPLYSPPHSHLPASKPAASCLEYSTRLGL